VQEKDNLGDGDVERLLHDSKPRPALLSGHSDSRSPTPQPSITEPEEEDQSMDGGDRERIVMEQMGKLEY